jgi:hypothetical protein
MARKILPYSILKLFIIQVNEHPISIEQLTTNLSKDSKNDMSSIRSFFKWICDNIRYLFFFSSGYMTISGIYSIFQVDM